MPYLEKERIPMKRVNEEEVTFRNGDSGPKYLIRGPKLDWGVLILKPGETLGPHYHKEVEETFFFLEGTPIVRVNEKDYRARFGDAFLMEVGDKHDIINDTDIPTKMVFMKSHFAPKDKIDCK
jgi:mannose-6-phosphate isomerase-like protein (cupin superfamily)